MRPFGTAVLPPKFVVGCTAMVFKATVRGVPSLPDESMPVTVRKGGHEGWYTSRQSEDDHPCLVQRLWWLLLAQCMRFP